MSILRQGMPPQKKSGYSFDVYVACKNTELESIQLEQRYILVMTMKVGPIFTQIAKEIRLIPVRLSPVRTTKQFEQPCQVNVVLDSLCDS
ncbi:hypothetical protein KSW81_001154 [Nannochloris sp. 'desiccata']|nr:hypothetical protein KSW81_001154 [Chlorella desiccata (nom. nud.)]